jgi:4'-phosphopantetheinyl transferase
VLGGDHTDLHFNVTHTDGLALIATATTPIGIDVERVRPMADADGLVRRFFSPAEWEAFAALPAELRPAAFFRGWTCKEAVIKAAGLSVLTLDGFDVEFHPARPPAVLATRHSELVGGNWILEAWEPVSGFAAAVAVRSR